MTEQQGWLVLASLWLLIGHANDSLYGWLLSFVVIVVCVAAANKDTVARWVARWNR